MIVKVNINGNEYEVSDAETVMNVCLKLGVFIPHLCYLKGFSPTGACGLCAVEFDGGKIALSCQTIVKDGMNIKTESKKLTEVRKLSIDKILENHNINCLNCSSNGACELQNFASQIYAHCEKTETLEPEVNHSHMTKASELIYDGSKCVECQRCVKFLNKFCNQELKNVETLDSVKDLNDISLNAIELCPTDAIDYKKGCRPTYLMEKYETFDVGDVFTPLISVYKSNNRITRVQPFDGSLIKNQTRYDLESIPDRTHDIEKYNRIIETLSDAIKAKTHEKGVFVVGDNLDIVSLYYLKTMAEKIPNVCICINDALAPINSEFQIGLSKSELLPMDCAIFLGKISDINRCHIIRSSPRLKESFSLSDTDMDAFFAGQNAHTITACSSPFLFVSIEEFAEHSPEILEQKVRSFAEQYQKEYARILKIRIIPTNLSQMLLCEIPNRVSLVHLAENFNRHDLKFICVVGDLDYDIKVKDVLKVSHSVIAKNDSEHIPSKHFIEDVTYHKNIFGEIIKTNRIVSNGLKSHREFLFDLMADIFGNGFNDINSDIHSQLRKNFFG